MKKLILCMMPLVITACSTPTQQSTVPMDMKAVQEYQQRVATGKTVTANSSESEEWELNQSDREPKVKVYRSYPYPRVYPTIGYHHGWGRGHHSGIGVGLGGFYY
ncbi:MULTISPECIES: hypothetical protein [Glaesserella]|uniref:Lipoprotein n=1 Tax=Glaesserella australis TaxID=2094024 RepID=A0A328BYJ3_9PAST|nr:MULTISPECIES: hypothetical protein [Glaesserella]AUI65255.1 hypothetical protein CJD39_01090 [Glaesserella sp. 15-184]RAL18527.1 hypothetical protein C5N92_07380 [Glaesserella australis]